MPKWGKILLCTAFSFMFMFISVGYARLTDTLSITGRAEVKEPEVVYITSIQVTGSNVVDKNGNPVQNPTVEKQGTHTLYFKYGDYNLGVQPNGGTGGKLDIEVTVRNNSGRVQYFSSLVTTPQKNKKDPLKQSPISLTWESEDEDPKIENNDSKTYTFTIQNTSKTATFSMKDLESVLTFSAELVEQDTENATKAMVKSFAYILAGKGPGGNQNTSVVYQGKNYSGMQIVRDLLEKNGQGAMNNAPSGGYMGNVGAATEDQKNLVNQLFGENIVIEIGDNAYSVSILIKYQEVNNDNRTDMVIYVTADQLYQGGNNDENNRVPVYALVYIKNTDGTYDYCDHLFEGVAPVCDMGGQFGKDRTGNFHTDYWKSTEPEIKKDDGNSNGALDETFREFIRQKNANGVPEDQYMIHVNDLTSSDNSSNSGNS